MATQERVFASAILCEKVLHEGDIVSAIRIIDTLNADIPEGKDPSRVFALFDGALLIFLKSAEPARGIARIVLVSPQGSPSREWGPYDVTLQGGSHGHSIKLQFHLNTATMEVGLYWFDVYWDDQILIRAPMRVTQRTAPDES
jgi:hypothetical protein